MNPPRFIELKSIVDHNLVYLDPTLVVAIDREATFITNSTNTVVRLQGGFSVSVIEAPHEVAKAIDEALHAPVYTLGAMLPREEA